MKIRIDRNIYKIMSTYAFAGWLSSMDCSTEDIVRIIEKDQARYDVLFNEFCKTIIEEAEKLKEGNNDC